MNKPVAFYEIIINYAIKFSKYNMRQTSLVDVKLKSFFIAVTKPSIIKGSKPTKFDPTTGLNL